jgi:signal peptidase II
MYILPIVSIIFLVMIDQFTKYIALTRLRPVGSITLIDGVLNLTFVENSGAAFGILLGRTTFLVVTTIIILIILTIYYVKLPKEKPNNIIRFSLILLISGAIGNFIDRVLLGYVTDFIHITFINFPVFNIADILIVTGTAIFVITTIFFDKK